MGKLLATAPSKEELEKIINEFYLSENYIIKEDNTIYNTKTGLTPTNTKVRYFRGRWRLEMK